MPRRMTLFILVCTALNLLSWLLYMYKLTIPKEVFMSNSSPVKSTLITARPHLPSRATIRNMKGTELEELFYTYVENMGVLCTNKVRLGNYGDGGWDVCDDMEYRPRPPCLVYSFGIGNDFSFDDAVSSRYGCEVHSFDPSMGVKDHKHSDRVFFHNIGLSDKDFVNSKAWTMKTLTSIKAQLNHTKINIIKMDIELDEYKALPNIMASGELKDVDQLLFEIHFNSDDTQAMIIDFMARGLELFRDLRNLGFYVFYTHRNEYCKFFSQITGRIRTSCNEVFMLNVNRKDQ